MVTVTKDLRTQFQSARDQGPRPTCLAFALSDAHAAGRPPHTCMSSDYLFYHAVQRTANRNPNQGVSLTIATSTLRAEGQPWESVWPYVAALPINRTNWLPPAGVKTFTADSKPHTGGISDTCCLVDTGTPAILVFHPTEAFYYVGKSGLMPIRAIDRDIPSLHAVIAVGYGRSSGQTHILLRNSWGPEWGDGGHAWLSEDYLAPRLHSVTSLRVTT